MSIRMILLVYSLVTVVSGFFIEKPENVCAQLGCDNANSFSQAHFNMLSVKSNADVWKTQQASAPMDQFIEEGGCVGNSDYIVCPSQDPQSNVSSYSMYLTWTGVEVNLKKVEKITDTVSANIRDDYKIFLANSKYAQMVDKKTRLAKVLEHPTQFLNTTYSPVYLRELGYHIVFGQESSAVVLYSVNDDGDLALLANFNLTTQGEDNSTIAWVVAAQPAAYGNRVYLYTHKEGGSDEALVALDFMKDDPHWEFIWTFSFSANGSSIYSNSKPADYKPDDLQLLATDDGNIFITSVGGLVLVKDNGTNGAQVMGSPFAGHFMSQISGSEYVWFTGLRENEKFRRSVVGLSTKNSNFSAVLDIKEGLKADDLNITTRILTVRDKDTTATDEVIVFGATVSASDPDSPFLNEICTDCNANEVRGMLLAIRPLSSNETTLDIAWSKSLPDEYFPVGSIMGLNKKLVAFLKNWNDGTSIVAAFGTPSN